MIGLIEDVKNIGKAIKNEIKSIKQMSQNIPSLMESIHFSEVNEKEDMEDEMLYDEMENEPSMGIEKPMQEELPGKAIVDQIRKMALKAMADLADHTEDSYYLVLKKIWQMADKNPEEGKVNKME